MRRTKTPVLTSPWKIGFFVALVLVFVSIGVAYYVVHQLGVAGTQFDRNWLNKNEWLGVIKGRGFLFEMLPLMGLVAVTSMISYLVIAGAVRKYKRYLDSGLDYRNLLSSLKDIEDLEDKSKIERIKNHPELQRLLLGLAEALEEKNKLLGEREEALEARIEDTLQSKEKELADGFAQECERLATAVQAGASEPGGIDVSNPSLRKLGEILRSALRSREQGGGSTLAESYGDLRKTSDVTQSKLLEIAHELNSSREGAQEIEEQLRRLAGSDSTASQKGRLESAKKEARTIVASLRSLEELNASLDLLSEETKGIAISSALHAGSGVGTQDDLVRLAEEVRGVAARFMDATRRFIQISAAMRSSAGVLDTFVESSAESTDDAASPEEALVSVLSRITLWVERVVVLSDKISNFQESYGVAVSAMPDVEPEETVRRPEPNQPPAEDTAASEDDEFETLDRGGAFFPESKELRRGFEDNEAGDPGIFEEMTGERLGSLDDTGSGDPSIREADQSGADRYEGPGFERISRRLPPEPDDERVAPLEPERFAVDSGDQGPELREPGPVAPETRGETVRPDERGTRCERPMTRESDTRGATSITRQTATHDADEDAVDLYDLGAVDYDPALHN